MRSFERNKLGNGLLGDFHQGGEGVRIVHGHVGEHLAVDHDAGLLRPFMNTE